MSSQLFHLFVEIVLKEFFPFIGPGKVTAVTSADNFDFSTQGNVKLTGVRFAGEEWESFIFIISPQLSLPKRLSASRRESEGDKILKVLRFYGFPVESCEWVDGGSKNLSAPADAWKEKKLMISIRESDSLYTIALPYFLLENILNKIGAGWCGEVLSLRENKLPPLEKVFSSVIFSRQDIFIHYVDFLRRLSRNQRSDFLRILLESGYVDTEHFASLAELRPESTFILNFLPETIANRVISFSPQVKELLAEDDIRQRWGLQLDYYLQNVFSHICIGRDGDRFMQGIYGGEGASIASGIQIIRNRLREEQFPLENLWQKFLSEKKINPLITSPGKEILVMVAASSEKTLPLDELYKLFRPAFKEELMQKIEERRRGLKRMTKAQRSAISAGASSSLRKLLEREVTRDLSVPVRLLSLQEIFYKIENHNNEELLILYNQLGFETFAAFFDLLQYYSSSPVKEGDVKKIFLNIVSRLPETEASIVEDIFFQRLNWNRAVTEEGLEGHLKRIREKIPLLERLRYIGGTS